MRPTIIWDEMYVWDKEFQLKINYLGHEPIYSFLCTFPFSSYYIWLINNLFPRIKKSYEYKKIFCEYFKKYNSLIYDSVCNIVPKICSVVVHNIYK